MARRRRHRNRRRSLSRQLLQRFASHSHHQYLKESIQAGEQREQQREFLRRHRKLEDDIIARSVFVTNVLDANQPKNLDRLLHFMEGSYGGVEDCFPTEYSNNILSRYPPVRIIFRNEVDVELLFQMSKNNKSVTVPCPGVGYKNGCITIHRSKREQTLLARVLKRNRIQFTASGLSLGHWFPHDKDIYTSWREDSKTDKNDEWLEEHRLSSSAVQVSVNLTEREISFQLDTAASPFALSDFAFTKSEIATFRFKDIEDHIEICHDEALHSYSLVFALKHLPKLYRETLAGLSNSSVDAKERGLTFGSLGARSWSCSCFKLAVSETDIDRLLLSEHKEDMVGYGLLPATVHSPSDARPIHSDFIGTESVETKSCLGDIHAINPEAGYALRALLDKGKFCWKHALDDTASLRQEEPCNIYKQVLKVKEPHLIKALDQILDGPGKTKYPCKLFLAILEHDIGCGELMAQTSLPSYCVAVPRAILTPCRLTVFGAYIEMSNRVIRWLIEKQGFRSTNFLRLRICDEDESRIWRRDLSDVVVAHFKNIIQEGTMINGVRYYFLAYSSSQLKELSMWMVAPPRGWTILSIRQELGDFSQLTASKFAARIGQCFSTTVQTLPSSEVGQGVHTSDLSIRHYITTDVTSVYRGRNMIHSDGTGIIEPKALARLLKLVPWAEQHVSIIQIRYGGAKGTLTAYNIRSLPGLNFVQSINNYNLILRPSMIKFEGPFSYLEVCRVGTHVPYYLNRNVIFLLGVHEVKDEVFLSMQQNMLDDLDSMLTNRDIALRMVAGLGGPDQRQKSMLLHMLHSGLSASTDPFLFSCLMSVRAHHLYNVRKKARIFVKEGGVFLGGLDETKMLPEECVFLQVATERDGVVSYRPVLGPVMVTKHPVMHPGDIRMYLAVDIPNLRHLKDVLIFSQKGGRPEPSKMSGSDLDGDEFAVTWNESLFLKNLNWSQFAEQIRLQLSRALSPEELVHVAREVSKANSDPLDYDEPLRRQAVLLPDNDEAEQSQALLEHFFEYSKSDSLGYIGMLWQDYAGKYGANCKECIQLADLHSIAVDFAKTGVPAVVPDEIKWRDKHPHWRELKEKHSYHCGSIVGRLYDEAMGRTDTNFSQECRTAICGRAVNKYGQVLSLVEVEWDPSCLEAVYDSGLASALGLSFNEADSELTNHLLEFASDQRESYEDQVSAVMNKFHLRNEGELFTGCIRKYHKFDKKRQQAVSEDVRRQCHAIRGEYRDNFFHEVLLFASEDNEADNLATQLQTLSLEETNISRIIATLTDIDQVTLEGDAASNPMLFRFDEGFERVLSWVEGIATQQNPPSSRFSLEWKLRKFAHMLAAAYYVVSYSPDGREELNNLALFSFPWMVSDVIASGLRDHASGSL